MRYIVVFILIHALLIGCGIKKRPENLSFQLMLDKFKHAGFMVHPNVSETDIFNSWKKVMVYHQDSMSALYITLGCSTNQALPVYFTNNCWLFDPESMEDKGSYAHILENLQRISNGDLKFDSINDYCNENEDNIAWVSFVFEGDRYKWDVVVNNDWVDGMLFENVQILSRKYNKSGRLTFYPEGQAFVISYLTEEKFLQIKKSLGIKLTWLHFDHNSQLE
jgi:hypothetical protein